MIQSKALVVVVKCPIAQKYCRDFFLRSLQRRRQRDFSKMQTWFFMFWFKDALWPKVDSQLFGLVDKDLQKLAPWQPHPWFYLSKTVTSNNGWLITFSYTLLCLCNFGEVLGRDYLILSRTPQTAITVLSTLSWGSDIVQGKKGGGGGVTPSPFPYLVQNPTYSSLVNIPSVTSREILICIPQKMVPQRESQGRVVNWRKA